MNQNEMVYIRLENYELMKNQIKQSKKVFIVQQVNNMMLMGCFKTKLDAEIYTSKSKDFYIIESEIQDYDCN